MAKTYCQTCGAVNMYHLEKPNFCQKCGKGFSGAVAEESDEENKESETSIPQLDGLEVEIDTGRSNTLEIGQLAGTNTSSNEKIESYPRGKKQSKKEVQEEFRKEAGTLRKK